MFSLRNFVKKGFISAVGNMADYKIILNAAAWAEKGVLLEEDLEEINTAIEGQYAAIDEDITEIATEEVFQEE